MAPMDDGGRSSDAATLVTRVIDAFNRRDVETAVAMIDPEAVFLPMSAQLLREGKPYIGRDGVRAYLDDARRLWRSIEIEAVEVQSAGDAVVVIGFAHIGAAAGELKLPAVWTWKVRAGLVTECIVHSDERSARKALGIVDG